MTPQRTTAIRRFAACALPRILLVIAVLSSGNSAPANDDAASHRTVGIQADAGTWMSVDVSHDGRTLVFDVLGDIYAMPIEGGRAVPLTEGRVQGPAELDRGPAVDTQPVYSPRGGRIAFVSDRSGSDNLWIMDADGSDPRRATDLRGVILNSPAWSPDASRLICRRSDDGRSGQLWVYPLTEDRQPERIDGTERFIDVQGPVFSPDGGSVYFSAPVDAGPWRRLRRETWQIHRADLATGDVERLTDHPGGAVRPQISPDGTRMAYAGWRDQRPSLLVMDLASQHERVVSQRIERNLQDMWLSRLDLFPGYAFAADGESIFAAVDGRPARIDIRTGLAHPISMEVNTTLSLPPRPLPRVDVGARFTSRMVRWPVVDEHRDRVIFEATGRIWSRDLSAADASAEPMTPEGMHAMQPALSPDGAWIAFVAANATGAGRHVHRMPAEGGEPGRITRETRDYARPAWLPGGDQLIAMASETGSRRLASRNVPAAPVVRIDIEDGALRRIAEVTTGDAGVRPGPDRRLWYTERGRLKSMNPGGRDERSHASFPGARQIVMSPDGALAAISIGNRIYVRSLESSGASRFDPADGVIGHFPSWVNDHELAWTFGGALHRAAVSMDGAPGFAGTPASTPLGPKIAMHGPRSDQTIALRGARILTMAPAGVIERGVIVIRGERIAAVGSEDKVDIPAGAHVIDARGKTVMPGLIDVHQHALALLGADELRNLPADFPPASVLLAFGVTTTRDPALLSNIRDFAMIELINSGRVLGPRQLATGERIRPEDYTIDGIAAAREAVAIQETLGATYIKEYLRPNRIERLRLATAARGRRVAITADSAFDYKHALAAVSDGFTGVEHSAGNVPIRSDFADLLAEAGTFYVPTVLSQVGAEHYFRRHDVIGNEKLRRFIPEGAIRRLVMNPRRMQNVAQAETAFATLTQNVARLIDAGVTVGVGSHDMPAPTGLGTHWEIWSFVEGGVPPLEALRAATLHGAMILGIEDQTGSIERRKLADLLILNDDPLQDIRATIDIDAVVLGGTVRDGSTLERRVPADLEPSRNETEHPQPEDTAHE